VRARPGGRERRGQLLRALDRAIVVHSRGKKEQDVVPRCSLPEDVPTYLGTWVLSLPRRPGSLNDEESGEMGAF
jgi:hypothetical protein